MDATMPKLPLYASFGCALLFATGCAADRVEEKNEAADEGLVVCTDPRPQICTMQYDPVCARLGDGDDAKWKTYASGCSACGDAAVSAYRPGGECK
jgi:hypothetical protein